jgi:uncharacterized protein YjbI with pentapeptide repeats
LDLTGATFIGSEVTEVVAHIGQLFDCSLVGTRISDVTIERCDLRRTNLTRAAFVNFTCADASFRNAYLLYASIKDSTIEFADFGAANLSRAIFDKVHLRRASFRDGMLVEARISDLIADSADLTGARAARVELSQVSARHVSMQNCVLAGSRLQGLAIEDFDLRAADLAGAIVHDLKIPRLDASGAKLDQAEIGDVEVDEFIYSDDTTLPSVVLESKMIGTILGGGRFSLAPFVHRRAGIGHGSGAGQGTS